MLNTVHTEKNPKIPLVKETIYEFARKCISLRRKKVAEDERLQELSGRVEERRAAIQQLREALRGARAHNEELEGAIEEVTREKI
jgi:chromosome segregation ATPase